MTQTIILSSDYNRSLAKSLVDKAPHASVFKISEANRTTDQNAKMWAMMSDLSRAKPDGRRATPEVWKALMMKACGHAVQFEMGIDGEPFPVGFRSSRLTKQQMSDLIEFAYQYGAQYNVQWTDERQAA